MAQNQDREIEKKYIVPSEIELEKFLNDARALRFSGLTSKRFNGPFNKNDTYYDTENLMLLRTGRCLRLGGKSETSAKITFKEGTDDPRERVEIADVLKMADALAALEVAFPSRAIAALHERIGYKPILPKLRVYKMFYRIMLNGCEVIFGHTAFAGRRGAVERIDLEIEAQGEATVETVERVGAMLTPKFNLILDMRSKYEVGMALVGEKTK